MDSFSAPPLSNGDFCQGRGYFNPHKFLRNKKRDSQGTVCNALPLRNRAPVYAIDEIPVEFVLVDKAADMAGKRASRTSLNRRQHGKFTQGIRKDRCPVKIDERRLISAPMGVMTLGAGYLPVDYMNLVRLEALITEDTPPLVAGIAELISPRTLRPLCSNIVIPQDRFIDRSMRPFGA